MLSMTKGRPYGTALPLFSRCDGVSFTSDPAARNDGPATARTLQAPIAPTERTAPKFPPSGVRQ